MSRIWLAVLPLLLGGCALGSTKIVVVTATPTQPRPTATLSRAPESSASPPAAFALTQADVPGNLKQYSGRYHSNAEVASQYGLDPAALQRRGRITSFETEFRASAAAGMLDVDDIVAAWKSAAGARWDYDRVVSSVRHPGVREIDPRSLTAPRLGDVRTAFSFRSKGQANNLRDYAIVFTRGRYRGYLQVVAIVGTISGKDVLDLANLIDRRIQDAH